MALVEAVNTATNRTARRRESRRAAAGAVGDAASFVSDFFLSTFFFGFMILRLSLTVNSFSENTQIHSVIIMCKVLLFPFSLHCHVIFLKNKIESFIS